MELKKQSKKTNEKANISFSEFVDVYFPSLSVSPFHKSIVDRISREIENSPDGKKEIVLTGGRMRGMHASVCIVDGGIANRFKKNQ